MKFTETSVPENFITEAKATGLLLEADDIKRFAELFVAGVSDALAVVKTKDTPTAIVVPNIKGDPVMAAIVEYNDNSDGEGQGNWNYYWTFDPADLDGKKRYDVYDPQMCAVINKRGFEMSRVKFPTSDTCAKFGTIFANLMSDLLQTNAKEKEDFIVEHEGYFMASAAVEDGKVVKSFLPDGAMKRIIKDDEATEKAA